MAELRERGEWGWDSAGFAAATPPFTGFPASWDTALKCDSTLATWSVSGSLDERRPINCITWYEAYAFCIWDGGFMPTQAEWELAASGGEERLFPWSDPPGEVTVGRSYASYDCMGDGSPSGMCGIADILLVGNRPLGVGSWGHLDLSGNAQEWVQDLYVPGYLPCNDCVVLAGSTFRVVKGGSWWFNSATDLGAAAHVATTNRSPARGVRCARSP